jgi:hypothetical protein
MSEQMDLTERKLSRVDKFAGRIVTVHVDTVALPGGGTSTPAAWPCWPWTGRTTCWR